MRLVQVLALSSLAYIGAASGTNVCLLDGRCSSDSTVLNLSGCQLIDEDIGDITECIAEFQTAGVLEDLRFSNNNLTSMPALAHDVMGNLSSSLERLFLDYNKLTEVPQLHLDNVYFLRLDGNNISTVAKDDFKGTPRLEQLYLNGNNIAQIAEDVMEIDALFFLDVANNSLTSFPRAALEESKLDYLYLRGNPLVCAPTTEREMKVLDVDDGIADCGPPCSSVGVDVAGLLGENHDGTVCCPFGCNKCGGAGCRRVGLPDFDRYNCCITRILEEAQSCQDTNLEAPCVLSYK